MSLNIYDPSQFRSQGIEDLATKESLVVSNGKITVDVVQPTKSVQFFGNNQVELEGKGITWTDGSKSKSLSFKGAKLHSNMTIDLAEEQELHINNALVLSATTLGPGITTSNLRVVGALRKLKVTGSAEIGQFAYLNSELNRIGINTDEPRAALGIREHNVELLFGSVKADTGSIGTCSNGHFEIITDNTPRITIQNSGNVHIHNNVKIHGKLIADEIETQRSSPLVFSETDTSSYYGCGIIWAGKVGPNRQFVYRADPDRICSTDTIDLAYEKYLAIDGAMVISKNSLGSTVTASSLTSVGVLKDLQVAGDVAVTRRISTNTIELGRFALTENKLEFNNEFSIASKTATEFTIASDITIGNSANTNRSISLFGRTTVGIANPDPSIMLSVSGPVSFDNKKFLTGDTIPEIGNYNKGDIMWNTDPKATDYIGWVCVTSGTPGRWLRFGAIATQ